MPTNDKKSPPKKTATSEPKPAASKAKPAAAAKKAHKAGKPTNSFLAENPAPRMRGNRK